MTGFFGRVWQAAVVGGWRYGSQAALVSFYERRDFKEAVKASVRETYGEDAFKDAVKESVRESYREDAFMDAVTDAVTKAMKR